MIPGDLVYICPSPEHVEGCHLSKSKCRIGEVVKVSGCFVIFDIPSIGIRACPIDMVEIYQIGETNAISKMECLS
jgi:hypothetical protein